MFNAIFTTAYSEHVPVLHIAGVPRVDQQKSKPLLHHTLGDGRFDAYYKAFQNFVCSHANLQDKATVAAEIDRVLTETVVYVRHFFVAAKTVFSNAD